MNGLETFTGIFSQICFILFIVNIVYFIIWLKKIVQKTKSTKSFHILTYIFSISVVAISLFLLIFTLASRMYWYSATLKAIFSVLYTVILLLGGNVLIFNILSFTLWKNKFVNEPKKKAKEEANESSVDPNSAEGRYDRLVKEQNKTYSTARKLIIVSWIVLVLFIAIGIVIAVVGGTSATPIMIAIGIVLGIVGMIAAGIINYLGHKKHKDASYLYDKLSNIEDHVIANKFNSPSNAPSSSSHEHVDRLSELTKMYKDGALTETEFKKAKKKVLDN